MTLFFVERRFIEKPLKPAPYQPITTTLIRSTPYSPFKPGHSSVDKIPISERELHRVTLPEAPKPVVEEKPEPVKPVKTIPEPAPEPPVKEKKSKKDGDEKKDKKSAKKYGSKLESTGSPSRSRSTTKELIREYTKVPRG